MPLRCHVQRAGLPGHSNLQHRPERICSTLNLTLFGTYSSQIRLNKIMTLFKVPYSHKPHPTPVPTLPKNNAVSGMRRDWGCREESGSTINTVALLLTTHHYAKSAWKCFLSAAMSFCSYIDAHYENMDNLISQS